MSSPAESASLTAIVTGEVRHDSVAFRRRVARCASGFAALGVTQGTALALLLRNDVPFLEATLAAQRLGAYPVPLNWHSTPDEIGYIVADCRARVLVVHSDLLTPQLREAVGAITILVVDTPAGLRAAYRSTPAAGNEDLERWDAWVERWPEHSGASVPAPASLIYTSGTSGRPKGVKRAAPTPEQALQTEQMRRIMTGIDAEARVLVPAPMYHSAPNLFAVRAARYAQLLVLPWRFDAERLLADIERHRITHLYAVPTMFHRLLALAPERRARHDLSSLRFVLHAGGPCPVEVKRGMLEWLGPIVHEYYGSTEAGPITFCDARQWLAHPGTVGTAIPGTRLEILDEQGNRLPPGEVGEICVHTPAYPDFEYLGMPEARAALQRRDLVASGDMGWLDGQGRLFLTDRKTDMIISGGVNIYPAEIEAALLAVADVADCAVFGIPNAEFGESVAAIVQPRAGAELSPDAIRESLRQRLAAFKLPRLIELRQELPREESGKIRKRLLRDPYWAGSGRSI